MHLIWKRKNITAFMNAEKTHSLRLRIVMSVWVTSFLLSMNVVAKAEADLEDASALSPIVPIVTVGGDARSLAVSGGTAFVVSKDGVLATAYHSISDAVMRPDKYKIFVTIPGKASMHAKVLSLDVINDLALLKVNLSFSRELKLRQAPLVKGESLSSIGYSSYKLSRAEGKFVETIADAIRLGLLVSASVVPGMSGGPVLDTNGEVVGINKAISVDPTHIGLIAVSSWTLALMVQKAKPFKDGLSVLESQNLVQKQLLAAEKSLLADWRKIHRQDSLQSVWAVDRRGSSVYCHMATHDEIDWQDTGKQFDAKVERCALLLTTNQDCEGPIADYWFTYSSFSNNTLSDSEYSAVLIKAYEQPANDVSKPIRSKLKKDGTTYTCRNETIVNKAGVPLRFSECTRPYPQIPLLMDAQVKVLTEIPHGRKQLVAAMGLYGFRPESIREMVTSWRDSIRPNDKPLSGK